jgi:hypothetical protein
MWYVLVADAALIFSSSNDFSSLTKASGGEGVRRFSSRKRFSALSGASESGEKPFIINSFFFSSSR